MVLEILLVAGMLYFLYREINVVIESHLFRIHSPKEGAWPELFQVLLKVVGVFLILNILMFSAAHLVWSRYISRSIRRFSMVLDKIEKLDFSVLVASDQRMHPVAELVELWFEKERARDQRLGSLLAQLEACSDNKRDAAEHGELNSIVAEYKRLLLAR